MKLNGCNFKNRIKDGSYLLKHLRQNHHALPKIVLNVESEEPDLDKIIDTKLDISNLLDSEETVFQITRLLVLGTVSNTIKLKLDDQSGAAGF